MVRVRLLPLAVVAGVLIGCGGPRLRSFWAASPPVIDGNPSEWEGSVYPLEGGREYIGIRNDGSHLYLCLATTDARLKRRILGFGMTLWLDPTGEQQKTLGIRFPLGTREGFPIRPHDAGFDPAKGAADLTSAAAELEILHEKDLPKRLDAQSASGVQVGLGMQESRLTYEIAIPLTAAEDRPYALGAGPGQRVDLGLETPEMGEEPGPPMEQRRWVGPDNSGGQEDPDESPGDRAEGEHEGWRHGGDRGEGPAGEGSRKPLRVWIRVDLAKAEGRAS